MLGNRTIRGQKALGMSRRLEPLHAIFSLACRAMRILTAVVEITTLAVFHPRQDLTLRCPVALQLIRDDDSRDIPQALEQLAKKLLRRLLIPSLSRETGKSIPALIAEALHLLCVKYGKPSLLPRP